MTAAAAAAASLLLLISCCGGGVAAQQWRWQSAHTQAGSEAGCGGCAASDECGEPLVVTPLLRAGKAAEARSKALVTGLHPLLDGSFSALCETDAAKGDALWFWFLPASNATVAKAAPTLVWLQGGPGAPSTYGMFAEIGPVVVGADGTVARRNESWNVNLNLLVVDNPSGVGFSPLGSADRPVDNEHDVGLQLTELLGQFVTMFPEQSANGIFVAGESYGGKYAPSAARAVDLHNSAGATPRIPLKGLVVADGWCDPATHAAAYAGMLYGMGVVDAVQRDKIDRRMAETVARIGTGDLVGAFDPWNSVWLDYGGDYQGKSFAGPGLFTNYTGGHNTENVWFSGADPNIPPYGAALELLCRPESRRALHVGNVSFEQVDQYGAMVASGDVMNTSRPAIEHVLSAGQGYAVLLYSGAWDGVVGAAVSEPLYAALDWPGRGEFNAEGRAPYRVAANDTEVAGFAREVVAGGARLVRVVVRRAGHILPADQPRVARDMIERFVRGGRPGGPGFMAAAQEVTA